MTAALPIAIVLTLMGWSFLMGWHAGWEKRAASADTRAASADTRRMVETTKIGSMRSTDGAVPGETPADAQKP